MSWPKTIYVVSMWSFFIFIFISIMINLIISWIQTYLFLCLFFRICPIISGWQCRWTMWKFSNSKSLTSGCCLAFAWFLANFRLPLLIKVLLIKKAWSSLTGRLSKMMIWNLISNNLTKIDLPQLKFFD